MFLDMLIFAWLAYSYKYVEPVEEKKEDELDLKQIEGIESRQTGINNPSYKDD